MDFGIVQDQHIVIIFITQFLIDESHHVLSIASAEFGPALQHPFETDSCQQRVFVSSICWLLTMKWLSFHDPSSFSFDTIIDATLIKEYTLHRIQLIQIQLTKLITFLDIGISISLNKYPSRFLLDKTLFVHATRYGGL